MRRALLALLVLAIPAAAPAEGAMRLKPGGLGPLKVGMTEAEVERALDRPVRQRGLGSCVLAPIGRRDYLMFIKNKLRRATVNSKAYATRKGVRVGDRQRAIRAAYGDKVKRSPHAYDPDGFYFSVTYGNRRLRFETDGERVTAMHGGRIPEVDYVEGCA